MTECQPSRIFGDMDYTIRLAEKKDAPALYGISLRSHTASYYDQLIPDSFKAEFNAYYAWSKQDEDEFTAGILRKIDHPDWYVAVAEQSGVVIGYTIAHLKPEGPLMLRGLFVDPSKQTKGAGTALFEMSLTWARSDSVVELAVIENNTVARGIYERHGFSVLGTKSKDFFGAKMIRMLRNVIDKT